MRIQKLRLGSLFGENHPPFRSYWSLSILRGVPVQLYIRLEPRCCTCIKVRDRTVAGRWWWCALNDYLAIAQFVRGHRSAGNNLSCHQMFLISDHPPWVIFFSFSNTLQKVKLQRQILKKINFCRKMRRLTNFITKLLQLFIFLDQIPTNKWLVARLCTKRTEKAFKNRWEDNSSQQCQNILFQSSNQNSHCREFWNISFTVKNGIKSE